MNKFYQVLSNLKWDDTFHKAGSIIDGLESELEYLVKDKVLRHVDGATSIDHAHEIIATEAEEKGAAQAAIKPPENTWEAKPDATAGDVSAATLEVDKAAASATAPENEDASKQAGAPEKPVETTGSIDTNLDKGLNL